MDIPTNWGSLKYCADANFFNFRNGKLIFLNLNLVVSWNGASKKNFIKEDGYVFTKNNGTSRI